VTQVIGFTSYEVQHSFNSNGDRMGPSIYLSLFDMSLGASMKARYCFWGWVFAAAFFLASNTRATEARLVEDDALQDFPSGVVSAEEYASPALSVQRDWFQQPGETSQQTQKPSEYSISVESALVVLDVLVTDEDGNVLTGLEKGNFRVLDNGRPQVITTFGPTEDPITIVMLLEYSGIAYDYFAYKAAYWGSSFLDSLDSKDWVALVTYDMKPTIQVDFTRNKAEVRDALGALGYPSFRESNMFDAIIDALEKLEHVQGKKSIILITTGLDAFSKATLEQTLDQLKKSDVTIFCVGIAEGEFLTAEQGRGANITYLQAKNQLQTFANVTGGLAWFPRFEGEIPGIFRSVAGFLLNEYNIGFSPEQSSRDGKYHKLKIEIIGPGGGPLKVTNEKRKTRKVEVFAREGYVAPQASGE
jgi:VWFA-related protein